MFFSCELLSSFRPRNRSMLFLMLPSFLLLGGCQSSKTPLPGTRESIIFLGEDLKVDSETKDQEITLPEPLENKAWPQAGAQPSHVIPPLLIGNHLQEAWNHSIGQGSSSYQRILCGPVTDGSLVFALDTEGFVSAYKADTGERVWKQDIISNDYDRDALLGGGVSYDGGKVYVASPIGEVLCLESQEGTLLWRKSLASPLRTAPTLYQGKVIVVSIDNETTALESETGSFLWSHKGISESAGLLGGASPAVSDGVVVVPYSSGEIYALKVENGYQLWADSFATGKRMDYVSTLSQIKARPLIDQGEVYVMSNGGYMASMNLRTGGRLWSREIGGTRTPAKAGDFLFLITNKQDLICLRVSDGKIKWITPLPLGEEKNDRWAGPVLVNQDLLLAGSSGKALLISALNGQMVREFDLGAPCHTSPIVAGKTVYFLLDNGTLCAWK